MHPSGLIPYADNRNNRNNVNRNAMMDPFGLNSMMMNSFGMFGQMNNFFNNMQTQMPNMNANNFQGGFSSSSSFMSFSSNGASQPHVYQESQSTIVRPGGVKEVRKVVKDSARGEEKRMMGQHIGDKAHVLEKSKNLRTGEEEEQEELINIGEDDLPQFNMQWNQLNRGQQRCQHAANQRGIQQGSHPNNYHSHNTAATNQPRAITFNAPSTSNNNNAARAHGNNAAIAGRGSGNKRQRNDKNTKKH